MSPSKEDIATARGGSLASKPKKAHGLESLRGEQHAGRARSRTPKNNANEKRNARCRRDGALNRRTSNRQSTVVIAGRVCLCCAPLFFVAHFFGTIFFGAAAGAAAAGAASSSRFTTWRNAGVVGRAKKHARSLAQTSGTTVAATGRAVISKPFGLAAALRARARFTLNLINKSANG